MAEVERSKPPYLQVFQHYQRQILNGDLRDGDRMPSVRDIAGEWGISSATAGKVIGALQSEGLVESRVGAGTTVITKLIAPSGRDRIKRRHRTGSMYHPGERSEIVSAEVVKARPDIASALRIGVGDPVIARRRVVYQHDQPVEVSTSYIPGHYKEQAPDLVRVQKLPVQGGTAGYIEDRLGKRITAGRDQGCSRKATVDELEALRLQPGSSVLGGRNWWMTADGEVIEYGVSAVVEDRWRTDDYVLGRDD